jgi:hypothetical protein
MSNRLLHNGTDLQLPLGEHTCGYAELCKSAQDDQYRFNRCRQLLVISALVSDRGIREVRLRLSQPCLLGRHLTVLGNAGPCLEDETRRARSSDA